MTATGAGTRAALRRAAALVLAAASASVLVDRSVHGVGVVAAGAVPGAGPWWAVVVGVAVLTGTGALPAWRLVGARPLALFLAPCLGALVAAASVVVTVAAASEPLRWYVAFGAAANAAALASAATHHDRTRRQARSARVGVGLVVAGAATYGLRAVGRVPQAPVARRTWEPLAEAAVHGHRVAHRALGSHQAAAHLLSSPLAAGTAAVTWMVTGVRSAASATSVLAVVTAAAVAAAACALAEVGVAVAAALPAAAGPLPAAAAALAAAGGPLPAAGGPGPASGVAGPGARPAGPAAGRGTVAVQALAAAGAVAWVLAAGGVAGPGAVAGDPTLLWSAAAVAVAVLCLVLPPTGWRLRASLVLAATCALAAPAGTVAAAVLALLVGARRALGASAGTTGPRRLGNAAGTLIAVAAVLAWPVVAAVTAVGLPSLSLPPAGAAGRFHQAWVAVAPRLWPAAAAAVAVSALATAVLGRRRRGTGLASDVGLAVLGLVVPVAALLARWWGTALSLPLRLVPAGDAAVVLLLAMAAAMAVWSTVAVTAALAAGGSATALRRGPGSAAPPADGSGTRSLAVGVVGRAAAPRVAASGGEPAAASGSRRVDGRPAGVLHPSP